LLPPTTASSAGGRSEDLTGTGAMKSKPQDASARERLYAAGKKLFAQKPYDQVAIDDIANAAGVAHGLLFHYFKSKLEFYIYVFHVDRDEMSKRRLEFTREGTPDERLRRFVRFHMDHLRQWPWSHAMLLRGGAPAKLVAEAEVARMAGVREIMGYFSDEPPTQTQLLLGRSWLSCQGEILLGWLQGNGTDDKAVLETSVELFYEIMKREQLLKPTAERAEKAPARKKAAKSPNVSPAA